jgi:hypothetical protein
MTDIMDMINTESNLETLFNYIASYDQINTLTEFYPIIDAFQEIQNHDDPFYYPTKIAELLKQKIGLICLEIDSSFWENHYRTIMDELDDPKRNKQIHVWIFKNVFKNMGFKYAKDCDETELEQIFKEQGKQACFRNEKFIM